MITITEAKHVVASFSHLCYKYIYSCVFTTLHTILYFDTHEDATPQRNGLWLHDWSRRPYLCTACAAPFFPSSSILHFPFYLPCHYLWPCSMCPMLDLVGCSSCILLWVCCISVVPGTWLQVICLAGHVNYMYMLLFLFPLLG